MLNPIKSVSLVLNPAGLTHLYEITLCRHHKVSKDGLRYGNKCLPTENVRCFSESVIRNHRGPVWRADTTVKMPWHQENMEPQVGRNQGGKNE